MRTPRGWIGLGIVLLAVLGATGCTRSLEVAYAPSLYRLPEADQLKGTVLGVATFEDRRSFIDRTEPQSAGYFMQMHAWRFGLTYKGREYVPVADLVQSLFVDEFTRAGIETRPIPKVLTKDTVPAMRAAGEKHAATHVLGGRVLVFEVVNEEKVFTIISRRAVTLELTLLQVRSGDLALETTVTQNDRQDEGMGILHTTNADRLMNGVFRRVVTEVVEQVARKLALDPRDVTVRVAVGPR